MLASFFAKPDPDADLVVAARDGDPRAFDTLVCRHQEALQRFLRARLAPDLDADDVAQETFMAAWRELDGFHLRCRFKTWLFGIALNLCASAARRERRMRQNRVCLDDLENGERGRVSLPDGFDWGAVVERVDLRRRLAELPEPGRQVLELYYYAELNLREISELLKVNLSTLKYWFYQAHERLRAAVVVSDEVAPQERGARAPR